MNSKMADFLPFLPFLLILVGKGARVSVFVMILCRLGQMFQVLANCSILSVISFFPSFLAACVWLPGLLYHEAKKRCLFGGELSSTFILLLHFLGSCDVNASCFPTSKSLGSQKFSAEIIWFVVSTCFLLFSRWGVLMAACHTSDLFKDNVGQQCWPQLGETTNSCPGNSYSYIGWIPSLEWFNFILPGWSTTLAG